MRRPPRVLIVDDDPGVRDWLAVLASRLGHQAETVGSGEEALEAVRERPPDLVTLDLLLPGMDGLEALRALKQASPQLPVIMISGHGPTRAIVEAVRAGAADFLRKPLDPDELELAFSKALATGLRSVGELERGRWDDSPLVGAGEKLAAVQEMIDHVADTDITVLIRGESGTGKELVAQLIYERSGRRGRPFVKVNCAALPSELLESELFGYEKGAFTGAQRRKLGKFEIANTGTIFLDEISEMHPSLQAKLLQVLQDGQFSRLGGEADVHVDSRVIAATNRDLETAVRQGAFREDLFYRLNVVTIHIPTLRERPDEIPLLAEHFLRRYAEEYGKPYCAPSPELLATFLEYHWPGNVRELENLAKRMVVLGSEEPVRSELARRTAQALREAAAAPRRGDDTGSELERFLAGELERVSLKRIARHAAQAAERRLIEKVLQRTRWNRKETAEILQISYKALLYKMRDAGLADRA